MLSEEQKSEALKQAIKEFKEELVERIVEKAFVNDKERIDHYITEAAVEVNREFKKLMPL